jgi:hypothetical protein
VLRSFCERAALGPRAWGQGLSYPFYVPTELRDIRILIADGRFPDAAADLLRRASLGSGAAAATLGCMCLMGGELGSVDRGISHQQCVDSANRGNGYAQYVVAWHEYERGNYRIFAQWLRRSSKQGFLPATGDLGRLFIAPPDASERRPQVAKRFFRFAIRRGHVTSLPFFLRASKQGVFGRFYRYIGMIGYPVAVLLLTPIIWWFPFSIAVFAYPAGRKRPLFNIRTSES